MSSTDQQADVPAQADATGTADAEVPAEHAVPSDLTLAVEFDTATRDQWRDLVAGVLRKAGREELPEPVEEALRRTVATGVDVAPLYTADDVADLPSAVGVRLLARTALHALEADAEPHPSSPPPPARVRRPAPGDTSARRTVDERREPDDEFHRPAG